MSEHYSATDEYLQALDERGKMPSGFQIATTATSFEPPERPNKKLSIKSTLLILDKPSPSFAGTLTRNALRGAPVEIVEDLLRRDVPVRGILINNAVANVGVATGKDDAQTVLSRLAELTGGEDQFFVPASTGVIGWRLPTDPIMAILPDLVATASPGSTLPAARAIMTTDRYPKVRSRRVGSATVIGFAKGAGMIEPSMGTMLAFLMTDAVVDREILQKLLTQAVQLSFNRISVDSDQSTSDMALALSSQQVEAVPQEELSDAIVEVCLDLAEDIVRNGEGVEHVIKVSVSAPGTEDGTVAIGKAIVNSPLVKTAIFGNDPNVGRIVSAIGDHLGAQELPHLLASSTLNIGGINVYKQGSFRLDGTKEAALTKYLNERRIDHTLDYPPHDRVVEIEVDFDSSTKSRNVEAVVLGADLSHGYVTENADYRS